MNTTLAGNPLLHGRVGEGWYGLSNEDFMTGAALVRSYCHTCSRDVKEKVNLQGGPDKARYRICSLVPKRQNAGDASLITDLRSVEASHSGA